MCFFSWLDLDWSLDWCTYIMLEILASAQNHYSSKIFRDRLNRNISIEKRQRKNQIEFIDRHLEWINFVSCNMRAENTTTTYTYTHARIHYNLTN